MENLLDISKGLHLDFHPISQPAGTYTMLKNGIRILSGALENEKGTEQIKVFLNKKIVGAVVIDRDIVLLLAPSEIGLLKPDDTYVTITTNTSLGFTVDKQYDVEGKNNFKGERVIYIVGGGQSSRIINLDDAAQLASPTFADDIKLQLTPPIPEITLNEVVDGGSLPTGVYQATARLLTRSTNAAPFGFVSPLVPIIDEATSADIDQQDGANPQTASSKAIRFTVFNIDPGYSFLEVAIISYIGTANVSQSYLLTKIPIEGRTSIDFTYSSVEQHVESVDLSAIAVKPVVYDSASSVQQKDGILVLSGLTAEKETFNFQLAANAVKVKYFIEEIPFQAGYKDALTAASKRGYMRGEVYSLGQAPTFKSSYNTTVYHIPAPSATSRTQANTSTKELGTYLSDEVYPTGKDYPTGKVRHFVMPTVKQEPLIVVRGNITYLRILGLEVDFTDSLALIPEGNKKNLKGFSVVRQIRTESNKSILSQGVANPHYNGPAGLNLLQFAGKEVSPSDSQAAYNMVGFFSPESVIYQSGFTGATNLEPVIEMTGVQQIIADQRTRNDAKDRGSDLSLGEFVYMTLDYTNQRAITNPFTIPGVVSSTLQYIPAAPNEPKEFKHTPSGPVNNLIENSGSNGYLFMKLSRELPTNYQTFTSNDSRSGKSPIPEFFFADLNGTDLVFLNGIVQGGSGTSGRGDTTRYLYNLTRTLTRQYGPVSDAKYIFVGNIKTADNTKLKVFGGDTFVNKFSVMGTGYSLNMLYKAISSFFVESSINTDLRHYNDPIGKEGESGYIPGTLPYYPKYNTLYLQPNGVGRAGLFNLSWTLGHSRGYNKQYSFENSVIQFFPKGLTEEQVTDFTNRSIYSEQSIEGEQIDAFRIFLPNNYHDIPRHKGPIINTFVHNGNFYHHTTGSLWQSFFNEKVTQASSIGEVYLGTGGVFSRPSIEIFSVNGGYAGTQSKSGISTPFGYVFIDGRQKKVFLLGEKLDDLTDGVSEHFNKIEEAHKFTITYDYKNERILLSSEEEWTLSYQTQLKSWTAFHDYLPYFMINRGQDVYIAKGNKLHKLGTGTYGKFFDTYYPTYLEYVYNTSADDTKSFDNLVVHSSVYEETGVNKPFETLNKLRVYNELKDTGTNKIIVPRTFDEEWTPLAIDEIFAKRKNDEFRIAVPFDMLLDINEPGVYADSKEFRPRMTGKWTKFAWTFNTPNRKMIVHTIKTIVRNVAR